MILENYAHYVFQKGKVLLLLEEFLKGNVGFWNFSLVVWLGSILDKLKKIGFLLFSSYSCFRGVDGSSIIRIIGQQTHKALQQIVLIHSSITDG